ncbi:MAG: hypothetical protein PHT24_07225 [Endomicrobiaceae bacterium]|nr:hypothetical protein [Endomicrobiaceae bacterium]
MHNAPLPVLILFIILYCIVVIGIIKPSIFVNLTIKYFKLSLRFYGLELEGDIKPTDKANNIARLVNFLVLIVLTVVLFSEKFASR